MFERFKRAFSGQPREPVPTVPAEPGRLDWITRSTPYRFRTWLAEPAQRDDVPGVLSLLIARELTIELVDEPDGRLRLDMVSTFEGWAAVTRALWTLHRGGVRVLGLERLDIYDDVSPAEIDRLVDDLETNSFKTAAGRRKDALTGEATLRYAIKTSRSQPTVRGWLSIAASAAHNTSGIDALLLDTAASEPNADMARTLAAAVARHAEMADLISEPFSPPAALVTAVAQRRDEAAGAGYQIAIALPAPLDADLTAVLCEAARRRGPSAIDAVRALRNAAPSDEVRAALEKALESTDVDVRSLAIDSLGSVFGTGARSYWEAWLGSSSAPQRMAAEEVLGAYGDSADIPLAAVHLGKIIRRKSSIEWEPPRGNEIIDLLVRYRELPEAKAALADLTKRWPKLPEELQRWLREHHPDLVPVSGAPDAETDDDEPEAPLTWPLPEIKPKGDGFYIAFWDTNTHDVRDRFEDLLIAHPDVTLIDGDREWTTAKIDVPDPESLIAELWARVQKSPGP